MKLSNFGSTSFQADFAKIFMTIFGTSSVYVSKAAFGPERPLSYMEKERMMVKWIQTISPAKIKLSVLKFKGTMGKDSSCYSTHRRSEIVLSCIRDPS